MPSTVDQFANFATSTIAGGAGGVGTPLANTDTSLILATGDGAKFPATAPFSVLLGTTSGAHEIVQCTARTSDTLTIVRAQEGTTAATWGVGTSVQQMVTAANLANVWARLQGMVVSVKDQGAKGDGTTDDTAAIQAAITAVQNAGGGTVFFPTTCAISNTLTISADSVQLVGAGRSSGLITLTGFPSSAQMVHVTAPVSGFRRGIVIRDMRLTNIQQNTAIGIQLDSTYYADLVRLDIEGIYATSIYLNGSGGQLGAYTHVAHCHLGSVPSGAGSAGTGILTNNHEWNTIESSSFFWFNGTGGIGIKSQNSSNIIRSNDFDECDTGIYLNFCNDNDVSGNHFDRTLTNCIHNFGAKRTKVIGNTFLDYVGAGSNASAAQINAENTGEENLYAYNTSLFGKTWQYAVWESAGPTKPSLYVGNDFGGYKVFQGSNGIFRQNIGFNPYESLANPVAPTVSNAGTGGTVAAGTYNVEITYVTPYGETGGSPASATTTTGTTSTITINHPTPVGNATGWYAYVTQAGGAANTATRQQTAGAPSSMGANLVLTAPPTNTGATVSATNTTTDVSTPAVPATTVALQNTTGVDVEVYLTGGTVTAVTIGNKATGLTSGRFRLLAGQTITLTYSVAPTWVWIGE